MIVLTFFRSIFVKIVEIWGDFVEYARFEKIMADCLQLILSLTLVYAPILGLIEIVTFPLAVFGYFFWIIICNGKYLIV